MYMNIWRSLKCTYTIKSDYISGAPDLGFLPSQKFTYIQITYIQIRL